MRRRRKWIWLLSAALLFALAAWLMARGDEPQPELPPATQVEMPRRMTERHTQRAAERRVLEPPLTIPSEQAKRPPVLDPVLRALVPDYRNGVVVVEANAVRHSPVGQLLLDCFSSRDGGRMLQRFREDTGIDPLEQVDRVAVADETLIVSGHFGGAKWDEVMKGGFLQEYGEKAKLYQSRNRRGEVNGYLGVWNDQLAVAGPSLDDVKAALDRVQGTTPYTAPPLDESQTYGEIYGVLSSKALAEVLGEENPEMAKQLAAAAERIALHVDTSHDVGIVADVGGIEPQQTQDLAKTLGGALALARVEAQRQGESELAELLDLARVRPGSTDFRVEMAVPLEVLEKRLRRCVERNQARADGG